MTSPRANHDELYRHARVYDVAFSYRDFATEVDFLVACARRWGSAAPTSFLEVAAGPGVHAIVAASRGMRSIALDLSESMMALCAKKAKEANVDVTTMVADMTSFAIEPVALAFNPITSISYLRTLDDLCLHMKTMAAALEPGGVYVVENNHPKDFWKHEHFVPSTWTMSDGPLTVKATWVAQAPPRVDAAAQLYEAVARYEITDATDAAAVVERRVEDRAWLRMTLPSELALAARLAGLEECAVLGDLDVRTVDTGGYDDASWRAVSVFRKP